MNAGEEFHPHEFEAIIERHMVGSYAYTVVFLDDATVMSLRLRPRDRVRVSGEVRDIPFSGAWQPSRGRWFLMLNKQLMRDGEFQVGDKVMCRFRLEPTDVVDVPPDLARLFSRDRAAKEAWEALTPGSQRGLVHRMIAAKTDSTRAKRLSEIREHLLGTTPIRGLSARRRRG